MSYKSYKKSFAFLTIAVLLLSGAVFTLGGFGRSGPEAAPNLEEYGLVGYWNMEEGTGQTVYDRSGNGNNGTLGASTAVAKDDPVFTSGYSSSGPGGTGLQFDGKDDYVEISYSSLLDLGSSNFTLEAWAKISEAQTYDRIVSNYRPANESVDLEVRSNNAYFMARGGGVTAGVDSGVNIVDNIWHHIVGIRNGTTFSIYVDGVFKNSATASVGDVVYNNINWFIGAESAGSAAITGSIDEVRIYNRALSADEIRQHYNQKKPVLDMKFDEGSGQKVYDESFNNNDGWLGGTSASETSDPTWTTGKYGSALNFDGTNDYVGVPYNSSLDFKGANQNFTLSAWIKVDSISADEGIMGRWYDGSSNEQYILKVESDNNSIKFAIQDSAFNFKIAQTAANTVATNKWIYVAGVAKNGILTAYINGIASGVTATYGTIIDVGSDVNVEIGVHSRGEVMPLWFDGLIDSVCIYNYARTQDEILADYNDGKAAHLGKDSQRDDGLVGYWNMEEGKGQTVYDRSGNGNNGTLGASTAVAKDDPVFTRGAPCLAEASCGGGLKFDGVDDFVDVGSNSSLTVTSEVTIALWIKTPQPTKNYQGFFNARDNVLFVGGYSSTGRPMFRLNNTSWSQVDVISDDILNSNEWYYITTTYNKNLSLNQMKLYVNGALKKEGTQTGDIANLVGYTRYIGKRSDGYYFNGSIDEVRIYNRALSADEIRQHYNQKKPILDMKFDEGSGQKAYDESFNSNDGWLGGTSASETSDPTWTSGKYESALNFDGTNDYVSFNSVSSGGFGTVSALFKSLGNYKNGFIASGGSAAGADASARYSLFVKNDTVCASGDWGTIIANGTTSQTVCSGQVYNSTNFPSGIWKYLAVTYDGSNIYLYNDGILMKTVAQTVSGAGNSQPFSVGRFGDYDGVNLYFSGVIDQVRIYNYARTQDEILADYNDGKAAHLGKDNQRDDGLVGYWNMEEGTGQTIYDRSGNGNNGTLGASTAVGKDDPVFTRGAPCLAEASCGGGLKFDGKDDYVKTPARIFTTPSAKTILAWLYVINPQPSTYSGRIVSERGISGWFFATGTNNILRFYNSGSTALNVLSNNNSISLNTWQQVAVVWDGSATATNVHIYVNGIEVGYTTQTDGIALSNSDASGTYLGTDGDELLYSNFSGSIDEVRIYNRALSADEIRQHYNQKKPVLDMKFDEGSGQTAYDSSFNSNDGTLGSTTGTDANDPTWTNGKYGSALSFSGSNQYVKISDSASLSRTSDMTFSGWFKFDDRSNTRTFIRKGSEGGVDITWLWYWIGQGGSVNNLSFYTPAGETFTSFSPVVGQWYYITTVIDSSNNVKHYINGILQSNAQSQTSTWTDDSDPLIIGDWSSYDYDGLMDEIKIYNYARTASEILADYNNGLAAHLR